jgi:hypothetical protein
MPIRESRGSRGVGKKLQYYSGTPHEIYLYLTRCTAGTPGVLRFGHLIEALNIAQTVDRPHMMMRGIYAEEILVAVRPTRHPESLVMLTD